MVEKNSSKEKSFKRRDHSVRAILLVTSGLHGTIECTLERFPVEVASGSFQCKVFSAKILTARCGFKQWHCLAGQKATAISVKSLNYFID